MPLALLDALAVGGARAYLRNAEDGHAVALVHAVTAPLALELVLPWLGEEDHTAALAYAWQAVAAIHVAFDVDRSAPEGEVGDPPSADALIEQALRLGRRARPEADRSGVALPCPHAGARPVAGRRRRRPAPAHGLTPGRPAP